MKKHRFILLIIFPFVVAAQDNGVDHERLRRGALAYKMLFSYADSLEIAGDVGQVSDDAIRIASELDKGQPVAYFQKSFELLEVRRYNDASFLYHLGDLRYRYYHSANPDSETVLASIHSTLGQSIGYYLRSNIENYLGVLKACNDYYIANDYVFYPKSRDSVKYKQQADILSKTIVDLEVNRETYQIVFETMRVEFNKSLDSVLEQNQKE